MKWDAAQYDTRHAFVSRYGRELAARVPQDAVDVLDLGCGTGLLTAKLAEGGRRVFGLDSSPEMIARARTLYPDLFFCVGNALALPFADESLDAVFSNAVFHWIPDHERLLLGIRRVLRLGGALVCEFGARGNIAAIDAAFAQACAEAGLPYAATFVFPAPEVFAVLLERCGFTVEEAYAYERPTPLEGGAGLRNWVRQFYAEHLERMDAAARERALARVEELAAPALWREGRWVADYRRLRALARRV